MRLNSLGIVILLVAGVVLVHNLVAWKDVAFGDETTYLGSGLTFSIPFKGGAQWGPLYAAWYAFWHLFIPDALDLYYFNWGLLSILAGLVVFLFLRSLEVSFWVSVSLAMLFLFSDQNLPLNPKISIAPFCLISGILAWFHFSRKSLFYRFSVVSMAGLLCAYCRPEFYLSFLLGAVIAGYWAWKKRMFSQKSFLLTAGIFSLSVLVLHLLFKNPLFSGEDSRSAVAFQQHFVVNYCAWKHQPEPATIEAQLRLFHEVLGTEVETLTDALKAQPAWALKHILTNVIHTLTANGRNTIDTFYQTLFRGWYSVWRTILAAAIVLLVLGLIDYGGTWRNIRQKKVNWPGLTALLTLIFPTLAATVLIYPRTHYLIFHLLLILWGLAFVITRLAFRKSALLQNIPATPVLLAALAIFVGLRFGEYHRQGPTPAADNIRFITKIQPKARLRVLEREWYRVFLKQDSDWIHVEDYTDESFSEFVLHKNINFILMTQDMQTFFGKDPGFNAFLNQLESADFVKLNTNSTGDYLLIKRTVLQ